MITIFQLEGTDWQAECRPSSKDIIIWHGNCTKKIICGETAFERNEKAHDWFLAHVPEYTETKMIRIQ